MSGKKNSLMMLLCVFCMLFYGHAIPSLWQNMVNGVTYNVAFTPPSPPSGYTRVKFDPMELFWERVEEYQWKSGQTTIYCAPKSYLNSQYLCQRDPRYYNVWQGNPYTEFCTPLINGVCNYAGNGSGGCCYLSTENADCDITNIQCLTDYLDPEATI